MSIKHLAIICDGNGRWAQAQGSSRSVGHQRGADNTGVILRWCLGKKIEYLTLYLFSTYNWERPPEEVGFLMVLLATFCERKQAEMVRDNVRVVIIGNLSDTRFPDETRTALQGLVRSTAHCTGMTLVLALSYDGADELERASRRWVEAEHAGKMIDFLDTALLKIPDPDLILRTSGEQRLSGFMPIQGSYAELVFIADAYPQLGETALESAWEKFHSRQRRFGQTPEQMS